MIKIYTGQDQANVLKPFMHLKKDENALVLCFPEMQILHPKTLYNNILKRVTDAIQAEKNVYILTYNDHVFNAVRIAIKKMGISGECHQYLNNGSVQIANIDSSGNMNIWIPGIWDTWDQSLLENKPPRYPISFS